MDSLGEDPCDQEKILGKGIFFTRLLLLTKETVKALTELENQVHGNKAERRKVRGGTYWW